MTRNDRYMDLWGVAEDHFGLLTTKQAEENGVTKQHLVKMAERGAVIRLGRGVYQVKHHVRGPLDHFAAAVAIVGETAYLRGASVLAMFGLCATNPSLIYVGANTRVRRKVPEGIIVKDAQRESVVDYNGIRCQSVIAALREAKREGTVDGERIVEASRVAKEKGLISDAESTEFES